MKQRWFFRKLPLGVACLFAMLFFGCKPAGTEVSPSPSFLLAPSLPAASSDPSPSAAAPAPTETPGGSPTAATPLPYPSPTPFAINAVYGFYGQFQAECGALLDDYAAGLSARGTADGLSYSLLLTEHRTLLSEGRVTIARLHGSDAEGYSGTLEAAAPGSGSMYGSAEGGYTFSYSYNDGRTLTGSFAGNALAFTVFSAEGTATLSCRMEKAGDVWTSSAAVNGYQSELTVRLAPADGDDPIAFGVRPGDYLPVTESIAEPGEG